MPVHGLQRQHVVGGKMAITLDGPNLVQTVEPRIFDRNVLEIV